MTSTSDGVDQIGPWSDHYCMTCYEVVPMGDIKEHREEVHDGSLMVDIVSIHRSGEDYIAQDDSMGHYSPHQWIDVDDHEMCAECGAVIIQDGDIPQDLRQEAEA